MPTPPGDTNTIDDSRCIIPMDARGPIIGWIGGMEIDGNVEFLGSFKERPISGIIVQKSSVVIVNQGPNKPGLLNTTS